MMSNKRLYLIPLMILVYFFFHYTTDLLYFLEPLRTLYQFLKYLIITGLLFFLGFIFFKNKEKFTLAFSTLLFIFLFYGSIIDTAAAFGILRPVAGVDFKMLLAFLGICLAIMLINRMLSPAIIKKFLLFWIIYSTLLIVYDAGIFLLSAKKEKRYLAGSIDTNNFRSAAKPDVFFFIFDMYPSDSIFKKYLGFDNSALKTSLEEKGFYVSGNAHALYDQTYYSLASTLSLKPLEYLQDSFIKDYKKKLIALKSIEHSLIPACFERSGYTFKNYSVFNLQDQPSPLKFNLNYHLENVLTATTFYNRLYDNIEPDFFLANRNIDLEFIKKSWSNNVKDDLATLQASFNSIMDSFEKKNNPSFHYFHFMMPHPPMLYDSSGNPFEIKDMYNYNGFEKTIANYGSYTKYANKELLKMVNKIFEKAGKNVVIIIQGDHGYREYADRFPDQVRHGILNAVYLPTHNYGDFTDTMTPIQTFKLVLKKQFGFNNTEL